MKPLFQSKASFALAAEGVLQGWGFLYFPAKRGKPCRAGKP